VSFYKYIFSIKNDNIHKVITIFGIKIKIKSKKLVQIQKLENIEKKLAVQQNVIAEQKSTIYDLENQILEQVIQLRKTKKELTETLSTRLNIPKVSVIIPIFNAEKYLRESLNCVINQTLKDIEIICVNDASTDNSLAILNEFASVDRRIKIISHETNQGPGAARNAGLSIAQGLYLSFLDADDSCKNDFLEKMYIALLENASDVAICSFNFINIDNDNTNVAIKRIKKSGNFFLNNNNRADINVELWNKLFRKNIVDKHNIKFPNTKLGDDTSFTRQYLMMSEYAVGVDEILYDYQRNNEGIMSTLSRQGEYIFESLSAQIYTLKYIKSLSAEKQNECIEFYLLVLKKYMRFFLKYVPDSRRVELLTKISDDILNKIPENYLLDEEFINIRNKNFNNYISDLFVVN